MNYEIPIQILKEEINRMLRKKLDQEEKSKFALREEERMRFCREFCQKVFEFEAKINE